MELIFKTIHGSNLYGTATPSSDLDYKAIYIPSPRQILINEVDQVILNSKEDNEKKKTGDLDVEYYTLQKFMKLFSEGQTNAVDMFFAPKDKILVDSDIWAEIKANKDKLLSKKTNAFVGYCRAQANKFSIKGERVVTAQEALILLEEILAKFNTQDKLAVASDEIYKFVNVYNEHSWIEDMPQTSGTVVKFWVVCGRKLAFTASIVMAYNVISKLVSEYGYRAQAAAASSGVDNKALSHAVRVAYEALELLQTGEIIFPLRYADRLLDMKLGKIPYSEISEEIEELLLKVEEESLKTDLREEPDRKWINDFVFRIYEKQIVDKYLKREKL